MEIRRLTNSKKLLKKTGRYDLLLKKNFWNNHKIVVWPMLINFNNN